MKSVNKASRLIMVAFCLIGAAAPSFAEDVPGAHPLSGYVRYELRDIATQAAAHSKVMNKLKLEGPLAQWNAAGAQPGHTGALAIEVSITDMKFVSGGKRAWSCGASDNARLERLAGDMAAWVVGLHDATASTN